METKKTKRIYWSISVILGILVIILGINYAKNNSVEKNTDEAEKAMELAKYSARLIEENGEDAFGFIRNNINGDSYAFVWSMDAIRLVFPPDPSKEGESVVGLKDAAGTSLDKLFIEKAKNGGGWVEYVYPKPGETESSPKRSYVVPATYGEKTYVVISGYYLNSSEQTIPPGGDKDEHGCIPSAGYKWCEAKQKCIRPWEESC